MKYSILFLFLLITSSYASWIWDPDHGWMNSKYAPKENAQQQWKLALQQKEAKEYDEAAELFYQLHKSYPFTPEGQNALALAAECMTLDEEYYQAYLYWEEYIKTYPKSEKMPEILQKEYELGAKLVRDKDDGINLSGFKILSSAEDGIEILKKLVQNSPFLDFIDDAQLLIANYYFKTEEYKLARAEYEKLINDYSKSEWCSFAQYQIANCYWKEFRGTEFDIEILQSAKSKFEEYLQKYPDNQQAIEAKENIKKIWELMAHKQLEIAEYYIYQEKNHAARLYLQWIILKYPDTNSAAQAKLLMKKHNLEPFNTSDVQNVQ